MNVAFHSFKGGVGRTKVMVGVACSLMLRENEERICLLDLDLDASGLNSIFGADEADLGRDELLHIYVNDNYASIPKSVSDAPLKLLERVSGRTIENGRFQYLPTISDVMKSEQIEAMAKTNEKFGQLQVFREVLSGITNNESTPVDTVFIDLKPGFSPAFLNTRELVEKYVIVARPDRQNIDGLKKHIPGLIEADKEVIVVVNMYPSDVARARQYLDELNGFLTNLAGYNREVDVVIPFDINLFFDDNIEFMREDSDSSLKEGVTRIADLITQVETA